jgi:hypothetical protein
MCARFIAETVIQPIVIITAHRRGQLFVFPHRILLHIRENGFARLSGDGIAIACLLA